MNGKMEFVSIVMSEQAKRDLKITLESLKGCS